MSCSASIFLLDFLLLDFLRATCIVYFSPVGFLQSIRLMYLAFSNFRIVHTNLAYLAFFLNQQLHDILCRPLCTSSLSLTSIRLFSFRSRCILSAKFPFLRCCTSFLCGLLAKGLAAFRSIMALVIFSLAPCTLCRPPKMCISVLHALLCRLAT
ncbi:uncharacterized protein LAESUDRAFT_257717 [Laetiporus sulphureus 93-53]|uniref:Uncharacterized protein n=1 Tax=Laetiporus sulphureus 93-53 TaxID=1314785 RepID=A0A165H3J5_9APHY|nr:uncharacterized protein LAESUDRAFT_257717 [Laetiporus sulphureus 93-53]KZT11196.1 hypothetical protein LAESUDRAFT_257717 [Laetiporus sulphureus 93-53]